MRQGNIEGVLACQSRLENKGLKKESLEISKMSEWVHGEMSSEEKQGKVDNRQQGGRGTLGKEEE